MGDNWLVDARAEVWSVLPARVMREIALMRRIHVYRLSHAGVPTTDLAHALRVTRSRVRYMIQQETRRRARRDADARREGR